MKRLRRLLAGLFVLIIPIGIGSGRTENATAWAQGVTARGELSDREKSLIDILRLPMVSVDFAWKYNPSDFDPPQRNAREKGRAALGADRAPCLPYLEMLNENGTNKERLSEAERCFAKRIEQKDRTADDYYQYHVFLHNRAFYDFLEAAPGMLKEPAGIHTIANRWRAALSDQNVSLVKKAAELEPQNVQYRGSLAALQVGLITVEYLENLSRNSGPPSAAQNPHLSAVRLTEEKTGALYREAAGNIAFVDAQAKNAYPALYSLDGALRIMGGENEKAEQALLKAVSLDQASGPNYELLSYLYVRAVPEGTQPKQEQLERLAGLLEKKCETDCSSLERRIAARIRFGAGRYEDAEAHLRAALVRDPQSLPLHAGRAVTLYKMRRFSIAEKELLAAKDIFDHGEAEKADKAHFCSLVAVYHLLRSDEESAAQWLRRALELDPNDPVAKTLASERE